jgi:hypothetical protein
MTDLANKIELLELMEEIKSTDAALISRLKSLHVVKMHIQDVPQFERGAVLPDLIEPTVIEPSLTKALSDAIEPQAVFSQNLNLPKRFEGIIQLKGDEAIHAKAMALAESSWEQRKYLQQRLIELEPLSRNRSKLTKSLFNGILFQTIRRRAPIAPFNTLGIRSSWCDGQKSIKKIDSDEAKSLVVGHNQGIPPWQAQININNIESATNIYKTTKVRVHPQSVLRYVDDTGKVKCEPRKTHSPTIVISNTDTPISYVPLEKYDTTESYTHEVLKNYRPLVEGTCLMYRL